MLLKVMPMLICTHSQVHTQIRITHTMSLYAACITQARK